MSRRHPLPRLGSAVLALATAFGTALAFGAAACRSVPAGDAAAPLRLDYGFEIVRGAEPEVFVTLLVRGADAPSTELSVADFSGGVEAGGEDLDELCAYDADGAALPVERPEPHRWIVAHEPGAELRIEYVVRVNTHQSSLDYRVTRRPILNQHLFHAGGALFLVVPSALTNDDLVDVRLAWHGLEEAGWVAASSFWQGPGPHRMTRPKGELHQSIFLAGELEVFTFDVRGHPLVVAAQASPGFDVAEFAGLAREIVAAERDFFDDHEHPYYLISLVPSGIVQPGSSSYEGTGLTQSFSLLVQRGTTIDEGSPNREGILFLLAHEMFHNWNGVTFGVAQPEELGYWFSEGFTEFYARRLLFHGGWISAERYVESLNESLVNYFTSPVRDVPNERIRADFWSDGDVHKLPYRRGDLIALTADLAIRHASGGERSLDDVMRELLRRSRTGHGSFSNDELVDVLAEYGGEELGERVWRLIEAEGLPSFEPDELPPCLTVALQPIGAFELGFDDRLSGHETVVSGVREGSNAHAAGLRDGQRLTSWSVHYGRADLPVRLQIDEAGETRTISYLPAGAPVDTPQFALVDGADTSAL